MNFETKNNLDNIARKSLPILKRNGVTKAFIFGSALYGQDSPSSDIDFLLNYREDVSLLDVAGLKLELEQALNRKVDLISEKYLHHHLKKHIKNDLFSIL